MNPPLQILHLEDDLADGELVRATLEAEGFQGEFRRVETEHDFVSALHGGSFDLILADYTLPSFDGLSALRIVQQQSPDVPFIFVSGTLGEDVAIEALKTGATDYVLKTRLSRLGPSLARALREAQERTERKRAITALHDSEEQWKAAFQCNPVMYFMVDRAGITQSVNAAVGEQLAYDSGELVGQPVLNIFHADDRDFVRGKAEECFQTLGRTMRWEARKLRKDGTVIWVRETANALLLKNNPVLLVVCEDITDRKRAEEAVQRSEKQLRDLVESMPAMAFVMRPDGSNEFVSQPWVEFSGLSREQTEGAGWKVSLHPDDAEQHYARWHACLGSGQPFEHEARHRDAQGNYRWLLVRAVPLRDNQGNILKWYGALTDIEDRRRAEAILAGEKRIFEMVARDDSLAQILESLCRLVEEQANGVLASILLIQDNVLRYGGAPSLPKAYIDAIDGVAIGPSVGSCGTAAYTGSQVVVEDIATDPLWADFRAAALAHSLRACWSTPIYSTQRKVIGTFAMYYREPRRPTSRDQQVIEQITHLAGIAIERKLMQEVLALSERHLAEAQRLTHSGSFVWDTRTGKALYLSDEWYRIYGFEPGHEHAWQERLSRIAPQDERNWRAAVERAIHEKCDYELEKQLVLPDGRKKHIRALGHPLLDSSGSVAQFLGTVTDITERKQAEETLLASGQLARRHVEVMMRSLDALARETPSERFLSEMLRTIGQQLRANRVLLWLRDEAESTLRLSIEIADGQPVAPDLDHPLVKDPLFWKSVPLFHEMFVLGVPIVCHDAQHDSRLGELFRDYLAKRGTMRFLVIPLFVLGEVRGAIGIHHFETGEYHAEEIELAQALAHHVILATHGQDLVERQREAAILKERTRMARDIHDTLAQGFTGVIVQLEAAEEAQLEKDPESAVRHVRRARELARESLGEARRSVHALRPQALESAGFADALKAIIENTADGTSLRTDFRVTGNPRELHAAVEENLLHIGQEALTNTLKHAQATTFQAHLCFDSDAVRLVLQDNGTGFVVDRSNGTGIGLLGMKERAAHIEADVVISSSPGAGTRIVAVSPYLEC